MENLHHILFFSDDNIHMPIMFESSHPRRDGRKLTCLAMKPLCLFDGGPSSEPFASTAGLLSSRSAMQDYRCC